MSWRSALILAVLLSGCHNPILGETQIYPPPERQTRPTFTQFRDSRQQPGIRRDRNVWS